MLYLYGSNVVTPLGVTSNGSVLIDGGRITAVNEPCPEAAQRLDAGGGYILPGFIDIHVHGGGGYDCMDASVETFHAVARAHCEHGSTAIVPTTMTCEDELLEKVIQCYLQASTSNGNSAEMLGLHLEGPFFSAASANSRGAQPITRQRIPTRKMLEHIIQLAQGHILRWDAAAELPDMEIFAQVMKENHILCSLAHSAANATLATQAFEWGFKHVTHFYNACTTFHKEDGIVHAGIIEAAYLNDGVTIELIGDGRHIPKESMLLAHRIKGTDRICLITDAMRAAGTNVSHSILGPKDTGVPVVIRDEVAQLEDFSSYAGSICTMDRALRVAHVQYGLPLEDVSRMLSLTPARLCGVANRKGSLEAGKDADIVMMDSDFQVKKVFVKGKLVHEA